MQRIVEHSELLEIFKNGWTLQQMSVELHAAEDFDSTNTDTIRSVEHLPPEIACNDFKCIVLPRSTLSRHGIVFFQFGATQQIVVRPKVSKGTTVFIAAGTAFAQMLVFREVQRGVSRLPASLYFNNVTQQIALRPISLSYGVLIFDVAEVRNFYAKSCTPVKKTSLRLVDKKKESDIAFGEDASTHHVLMSEDKIEIGPDETGFAIWTHEFRMQNPKVQMPNGSGVWDPGFRGVGQLSLVTDEPTEIVLPPKDVPVAYLFLFRLKSPLSKELCYNGTYQDKQ